MTEDKIEFYRHALSETEIDAVAEAMRSLFITLGPKVAEFEAAFSRELGVAHAIGVSSCSMGLILALEALGVGPGTEVITTPMTFVATPNAVLHLGATPVFVDVVADTGLIDVRRVEEKITARTKAIVPVHLYGQLADMRALRSLADRHGLALVGDAAHAVESRREGYGSADLADATVFSFYATKNLTSGDGGAIAVHDASLAEALRSLRNHGITKDAVTRHGRPYSHWDMLRLGFKAAMTDIEAAMLIPQLERLGQRRASRERLVDRYEALLADEPRVSCMARVGTSAHHLFTVLAPPTQRDKLLFELAERGIGCAVNYRAVHTLQYYQTRFGFEPHAYPVAANIGDRTLSLPLWPDLPLASVDRVVHALRSALDASERPLTRERTLWEGA